MPIKTVTCYACGIELEGDDIYFDHANEEYYCHRHLLLRQIKDAKDDIREKADWLRSTYGKEIRDMRNKLTALEREYLELGSEAVCYAPDRFYEAVIRMLGGSYSVADYLGISLQVDDVMMDSDAWKKEIFYRLAQRLNEYERGLWPRYGREVEG